MTPSPHRIHSETRTNSMLVRQTEGNKKDLNLERNRKSICKFPRTGQRIEKSPPPLPLIPLDGASGKTESTESRRGSGRGGVAFPSVVVLQDGGVAMEGCSGGGDRLPTCPGRRAGGSVRRSWPGIYADNGGEGVSSSNLSGAATARQIAVPPVPARAAAARSG
jgi:hypothetical protein